MRWTRYKKDQQIRERLVVLQFPNGRRVQHTTTDKVGLVPVPYFERYSHEDGRPLFGQILLEWNGRDMTVSGLPVYR